MFKGMKDLVSLFQSVGKMQAELERVREELRHRRVEGSAGGGLVRVTMNGRQEVIGCQIDPSVAGDVEMLEDLVVAAVNMALVQARKLMAEEMGRITGVLDPELQKSLSEHLEGLM